MLEHPKTMDKNYCRLCLKHDLWNSPLSVFAEGFEISKKILSVHGIQIAESDSFSKVICHLCLAKLEFMDDIRRSVLNSNSILNNIAGEQVVVGDEEEEEEGEEDEDGAEEEEKTERTCNRCQFVTSCASELSVHLELHNSESPRNCPRCEVTVLTENELVEHMKQKHKHRTLAIHYCTQCCHLFYGNSQFYQHCRTQHGGGLTTDRHQNKKRKKSENRKSRRRKERVKCWKPVETHRERIVLKISKTTEDGSSNRGELMQLQTNSNDSQVGNKELSSNSQGHQLETSQVAIVNKQFSSNSQGHHLQTSSNSQAAIVNKQFSSNSQGHQSQTSSNSQVAIVNKQFSSNSQGHHLQKSSNSQVAIVNKQFSSNSQGHHLHTSSNSQVATSGMNDASLTDINNSQTTLSCSQPTKDNIRLRTENGDTTPSKKGRFDHGEKQRRGLDEKEEFPQSRLDKESRLNEKTCHPSPSSADRCHLSEGCIPSRTEIPENGYTARKRGLSAGFVPNSMENISGHEKGVDIVKNSMDNITSSGKGVDIVKGTAVSLGKENSEDCNITNEETAAVPLSSEVRNIGATAVSPAKQNSEDCCIEKERTAVSPAKQNSEDWNITDEEMKDGEIVKVKDLAKAGNNILVDLNESYHDLVIDDENDLLIIDEKNLRNDNMKVNKLQTTKHISSERHHQEPGKMPHETSGVVEGDLVIIDGREPGWLSDLKTARKQMSSLKRPQKMPSGNLAKVDDDKLSSPWKPYSTLMNEWDRKPDPTKLPQKMPSENLAKVDGDKLSSPWKPYSTLMNEWDRKPDPTKLPQKMPDKNLAKVDGDKLSSPWNPNSTLMNEWDRKPDTTKHLQKMPNENLAKVDDDKLSSPWSPDSTLMNETVLDEWDKITAADKIYIDVDDDDVMMMTNDDHDDVSEVLSSSVDGSSSCSCCSPLNNNNFDLENLIEVKDEYPSPNSYK